MGRLPTAHFIIRDIGAVMRYAVITGRAAGDPTRDLRGAVPAAETKHLAAITDPKRFGQVLRGFDTYQGGVPLQCALRLAPLLFVRSSELRTMRWADVDLENGDWRFLVKKTKTPHIVPLASQAVAILRELHPLTGCGEFVFPSTREHDGKSLSENAILYAIRRMGIGKEELCAHGFRATARTLLDEVLGFRLDLIEAQLAHKVADALGRAYNRTTFLSERREMMQTWADYLDQLKAGEVPQVERRTA